MLKVQDSRTQMTKTSSERLKMLLTYVLQAMCVVFASKQIARYKYSRTLWGSSSVSMLLYHDNEKSFTHQTQNITYWKPECRLLYTINEKQDIDQPTHCSPIQGFLNEVHFNEMLKEWHPFWPALSLPPHKRTASSFQTAWAGWPFWHAVFFDA